MALYEKGETRNQSENGHRHVSQELFRETVGIKDEFWLYSRLCLFEEGQLDKLTFNAKCRDEKKVI